MTNASTSEPLESKRQAIFYPPDGPPLLELAAEEFIFPLLQQPPQLYVHLSPYEDWEIKKFYDGVIPYRRQRSSQESTVEIDTSGIKPFIDAHFLGLSNATLEDGTEPTLEQQRKWLDDNSNLKIRLFRNGLDSFEPRRASEDRPKDARPQILLGQQETVITAEMVLYSRARSCEERIGMKHVLARLSEADRHQYDRAISFIENSNRREARTEANWDVILGLYNRLIKRIDGAVLAGSPCTEASREQWIKKVTFCMKIFVMSSAYTELDIKNG